MPRLALLILLLTSLLTACERTGAPDTLPALDTLQPEQASGYTERTGWLHTRYAVAAANPLAAEAGKTMLAAGGSAIDAAIAAQLVLGLVEPQSSGLGGGGFLLSWDGEQLVAWDGREVAPASAGPDLFMVDGEPMTFPQAVTSGLGTGVPGMMAMLAEAHQQQGHLPWARLFTPAITLAEQGFAISPRLHTLLQGDRHLRQNPLAAALYYQPDGDAHPVGTTLRNPAYGAVLRQLAELGGDTFYRGAIAEDIIRRVNQRAGRQHLQVGDFSRYRAIPRSALCTRWQQAQVCGFPPPSSGHLTIMQLLGILDQLDTRHHASADSFYTAAGLHDYLEAAKLAFADRARFIADPDFVTAPGGDWSSLLSPAYLRHRSQWVQTPSAGLATAGNPAPALAWYAPQPPQPEFGTTHISVIDAQGRAVAMTTSIEQAFGSRLMSDGGTGQAGGFLLNNQLTDFSFRPTDAAGHPIANRVEPGKRPRSSMSPTLVFNADTGELVASLGSPGGAAIIHYTAKTLLGLLPWQLSPQDTVALPNLGNFNSPQTLVETGRFSPEVLEELISKGHTLNERDMTSGIQALQVTPQGIAGGADPRREGSVAGE
ncbi:MAG: gamma-glutamyltransferase family protein [Marinobacter sp.]|nr:gamma-glutamyltransferase family protein [Marinobacter sp.]